jgi:hypothetical protein
MAAELLLLKPYVSKNSFDIDEQLFVTDALPTLSLDSLTVLLEHLSISTDAALFWGI